MYEALSYYLANLETDKALAPCIPSGRLQHYWYITGTVVALLVHYGFYGTKRPEGVLVPRLPRDRQGTSIASGRLVPVMQ